MSYPEDDMNKRVNYRKIAFDAYGPLCAHCGFGVPAVLEVAHLPQQAGDFVLCGGWWDG
jgi:hypothetical protein